ncbi:acetyltransferase (GNAT) family protein [Ureibacillus xyleni]|uniref:Acetyltransferase (GNAT) family protein n=1 Tax=Ureibacillus xyleni TaxID=614648 RepID=A0A285SXN9_9BACL|nr:GNAT family N-acetyltransferase [Ureibacillus xyleni]SOC13438.1 acetyltransferase (GNAT) family protein [Ureibacillus xyleni]
MDTISLRHFEKNHLEILKSFHLPAEQKKFTALPIDILEETEGKHPIVIVYGDAPVGFFLLHNSNRVKEYSANPHALLLTAFSINHLEQGKGFAKKAMQKLSNFVKSEFPSYNEIVLAVNYKNIPAQELYRKVGFYDTGERKIGPIGEQYIMKMKVEDK